MSVLSLEDFQQSLGLSFRDPALLEQAMTHASAGGTHNERLEFLGDAVLTLIVTEKLFHDRPDSREGELTEIKGHLVSGAELAAIGARLGLDRWLRVGRGLARSHSLPRSLLANALEALIGAIYLDSGLENAKRFALQVLNSPNSGASGSGKNFKMILQSYAQKKNGSVPSYRLIGRGGPSYSRAFEVCAVLGKEEFPSAWGKTKKEAEQWAAREALLAIEAAENAPPEE